MENVAHGYKKPNILDVKLGARLWADDAPPAKRAKLDKVAEVTTSNTLGFRVAGMRIYQGPEAAGKEGVNEDLYKFYDKEYGRALTAVTVADGFREYFHIDRGEKPVKNTKKTINRFIDDLKDLQGILEREESRMYSASLLFVYEGDPALLHEAFTTEKLMLEAQDNQAAHQEANGVNGIDSDDIDEDFYLNLPNIQVLKLIDFAHAQWTPGQGPDENLLHGIRNVIKTLQGLFE